MNSNLTWTRAAAALLCGAALLLAGCGGDDADPAPTRPADAAPRKPSVTRETVVVAGERRRYVLHHPGGRGRVPLLLAFHGRWSSPAELRDVTRLHAAAGRAGAAVAYPAGVHDGWGDDPLPTSTRPDPAADVRFSAAVIRALARRGVADPARVYAVGHSNGGSMALRLAAERPDLIAAVATTAAQLPRGVRPRAPLPTFLVYGSADPLRPPAGLPGPHDPDADGPTPSHSILATARAFAAPGAAPARAARVDRVPDDGTAVRRTTWGGRGDPPVVLWTIEGGGHTWPGGHGDQHADVTGPTSRELDASAVFVRSLLAQRRGS